MYWEGFAPDQWDAVMTARKKIRRSWRSALLQRFTEVFGGAPEEKAAVWSDWADSHFLAAACLGTLAECLKRSVEVESIRTAGRLSTSMTGEFIPFALANDRGDQGGDRLVHLWMPIELASLPETLR
jgi:hypothetical protein